LKNFFRNFFPSFSYPLTSQNKTGSPPASFSKADLTFSPQANQLFRLSVSKASANVKRFFLMHKASEVFFVFYSFAFKGECKCKSLKSFFQTLFPIFSPENKLTKS
jgi:hypothetical protein